MDLRTLPSAVAASLLLGSAAADEIHTIDGRTIDDVEILAERLAEIEYRTKDRKTQTLPADDVLMVHFSSKPQLVDRADAAILDESYPDAQTDLLNFLEGLDAAPRKWPWSRAYALYRLLEVSQVLGDMEQVSRAADLLRTTEADSRYLPMALMAKAQALYDTGDGEKALTALGELRSLVESATLGGRWRLEVEVAAVLLDASVKGAARESKLRELAESARAHVQVRSRAEVALGESLVTGGKIPEAEGLFRNIVKQRKADDRTLAAAYTGLGDCLFSAGEPAKDTQAGQTKLFDALMSYMRVVVSHKNQLVYVPKAMFYAGRCKQLLGGETADDDARKLYLKLLRTFPDSRWASEARGFLPKKSGAPE